GARSLLAAARAPDLLKNKDRRPEAAATTAVVTQTLSTPATRPQRLKPGFMEAAIPARLRSCPDT
ncbi:MAG: hypothetical protein KGM47_02805, partial [Acidobacteriota bacterium]|nr:hypothetical protein [Acidobacteriota bacterium]